jgi:hypothetical protein
MLHCSAQTFTRLGKDHVGRSNAAAAPAAADPGGDGSSKGSSIADMLAAEVAELKDKKKDRFKRREGGVRGTLFLEFPQADGELTGWGGGRVLGSPSEADGSKGISSRWCCIYSVVRQLCSTAACDGTSVGPLAMHTQAVCVGVTTSLPAPTCVHLVHAFLCGRPHPGCVS